MKIVFFNKKKTKDNLDTLSICCAVCSKWQLSTLPLFVDAQISFFDVRNALCSSDSWVNCNVLLLDSLEAERCKQTYLNQALLALPYSFFMFVDGGK